MTQVGPWVEQEETKAARPGDAVSLATRAGQAPSALRKEFVLNMELDNENEIYEHMNNEHEFSWKSFCRFWIRLSCVGIPRF